MISVPQFIKECRNGDCLTTIYGDIILVQRVDIDEKGHVCIYYYFNYDASEKQLNMNEWLTGFYGPKFDPEENFYRKSTDEERKYLFELMEKRGYHWKDDFDFPTPTSEEICRLCKIFKENK